MSIAVGPEEPVFEETDDLVLLFDQFESLLLTIFHCVARLKAKMPSHQEQQVNPRGKSTKPIQSEHNNARSEKSVDGR